MATKKQTKARKADRHAMATVVFRAPEEEMAQFRAAAAASEECEHELAKWLRAAAREKLKRQR